MNRRQVLKAGVAGVGTVGALGTLSASGAAWKDLDIDVYCKIDPLMKLEVADGAFELEPDRGGRELGENRWGFWHHEIEVRPTRTENGEIREFEFSSDADIANSIVVKGGPETKHYIENPVSPGSDGTGLHAPVNTNASNGDSQQYHGVSYVEFRRCYGLQVDITGTSNDKTPAEIIDLANDDIRLTVSYGPRRRKDQVVFDAGVEPNNGNGEIKAGGDLHFWFPYGEPFLDDPRDVGNPSKFRGQLLVEGADGTTWAGSDVLPEIV